MKRVLLLFTIGISILLLTYYFIGLHLNNKVEYIASRLTSFRGIECFFQSHKIGVFTSDATISLKFTDENESIYHQYLDLKKEYPKPLQLLLKLKMYHGPIPFTSSSFSSIPNIIAGSILIFPKCKTENKDLIPELSLAVNMDGSGTLKARLKDNGQIKQGIESNINAQWEYLNAYFKFSKNIIDFEYRLNFNDLMLSGGKNVHVKFEESILKGNSNLSNKVAQTLSFALQTENLLLKTDIQNKKYGRLLNASLQGIIENNNGILNAKMNIAADKIVFNKYELIDLKFKPNINGLHLDTMKKQIKTELGSKNMGFPSDITINFLRELLQPGVELNVDPFSVNTITDKYHFNGWARVSKPLPINDILKADPFGYFRVKLNLSLPKSVILDIVQQQIESESIKKAGFLGQMASGAGIIDQLVAVKIKDLEKNGILKKEGANYRIQIELNEGRCMVNDRNFSVKDLF